MARILVTGASGFIGCHLIDSLLERGDRVVCLARYGSSATTLTHRPVEIVRGEITDQQQLRHHLAGIDEVYHVAGLIRARSLDEFMAVNATGTECLLQQCAERESPPVVVLVSSLAAAGPSTDRNPLRETDPCQPVSHYGKSKRAGELVAARLADRVPVSIVRPPAVFGPGDKSMAQLYQLIDRWRTQFVPGYRHHRRYSFVHVTDLVAALLTVAERGSRLDSADASTDSFRQGCYFVADGQHLTLPQFGNLVGDGLGRKFVFKVPVPDSLTKLIGIIRDCLLDPLTNDISRDKARELTAGSWVCSAQTIAEQLGFSPAENLPDRLRSTIAAYQQERDT